MASDFLKDNLLLTPNLGQESWWSYIKDIGTPLIQNLGDICDVIFLWRDPEGNQESSSTCTVYIEVNYITDHHQPDPQQLTRIDGTDVWFWQTSISSDWHGTYQLIPVSDEYLAPLHLTTNHKIDTVTKKQKHRQWWRSILALSVADSFNKSSPKYCLWGNNRSLLYLSKAPKHAVWQTFDASNEYQCAMHNKQYASLQHVEWASPLLQNNRSVWMFETEHKHTQLSADKPLVMLLDGENWAELMPIFSVLQTLTDNRDLTPAFYVFVGNASTQQRPADLGCNPLFWQAVHDELFCKINNRFDYRISQKNRCVVGQSLGGLAAMFAGLTRPDMFNQVICQSGSFWWPTASLMQQWMQPKLPNVKQHGWLTTQVLSQKIANKNAQITMQIGNKETRLQALNQHFYQSLINTNHKATITEYCGGHDQVCWREGLISALCEYLKPTTEPFIDSSTCSELTNDFLNNDPANCGY